jgi:hypothetical protein
MPTRHRPAQAYNLHASRGEKYRSMTAPPGAGGNEWKLAILKRWYYRTNKVGEIFFEDEHGALPMRRVVRAVGRVLKREQAAGNQACTYIRGIYRSNLCSQTGLLTALCGISGP